MSSSRQGRACDAACWHMIAVRMMSQTSTPPSVSTKSPHAVGQSHPADHRRRDRVKVQQRFRRRAARSHGERANGANPPPRRLRRRRATGARERAGSNAEPPSRSPAPTGSMPIDPPSVQQVSRPQREGARGQSVPRRAGRARGRPAVTRFSPQCSRPDQHRAASRVRPAGCDRSGARSG